MRLLIDLPEGEQREVLLAPADATKTLTEVLRREHLPLNTRCGERGLCNACMVELIEGEKRTTVRGCQMQMDGKDYLHIAIPKSSLLTYEPKVQEGYRLNVPYAHAPIAAAEGLGIAIDIGTTTIVVQIVEFSTGTVLGKASAFNRQMHFGDDVLTRINLCTIDKVMIDKLQEAVVVETIVPLVEQALSEAHRDIDEILAYVVSGNTTMLHLFAGVDPTTMGVAPFTPTFIEHQQLFAGDLGLQPGKAAVHLLPGASAYVGADLTGGVLASGLVYDDGPSLLVDVGTNGEIILKQGNRLLGCATAAGPAFEGSGLANGLRAGVGAISHVEFQPEPFEVFYELIEFAKYTKPLGICGSAYVDILADGRRKGLLTETGRWNPERVQGMNEHLIPSGGHGKALRVAHGLGQKDIIITEPDIGSLLQAKAAIAAGIVTLLQRAGVEQSDVKTLYLAGGFGMHLNLQNAIDCGLLPGFKVEQIQLVGNTSLAGAFLSSMDRGAVAELQKIGHEMEIVELNLDPNFEMNYIDCLSLP